MRLRLVGNEITAHSSLLILPKLAEIAVYCLHNIRKLTLITARIAHKIGHHATQLLPSVVRILKFRSTHMCAKYREKHRNKGFMHVF